MHEYNCTKEKDIETIKIDLAVAQSDIRKISEDTINIKRNLEKFNWWFLGILSSSLVTFLILYLQVK